MENHLLDVFRQYIYVVIIGVSLLIIPGLIIGLCVALFQALTQVNEMTLSFLPKLLVMLVSIALLMPWMFGHLTEFTKKMIMDIPFIIS